MSPKAKTTESARLDKTKIKTTGQARMTTRPKTTDAHKFDKSKARRKR